MRSKAAGRGKRRLARCLVWMFFLSTRRDFSRGSRVKIAKGGDGASGGVGHWELMAGKWAKDSDGVRQVGQSNKKVELAAPGKVTVQRRLF